MQFLKIILSFMLSFNAMAASEVENTLKEACKDNTQVTYSEAMKDENGKEVYYRYLKDKETGQVFDCRGVDVKAVSELPKDAKTEASSQCEDCDKEPKKSELEKNAETMAVATACPSDPQSNKECLTELGCMAVADVTKFMLPFLPVAKVIPACKSSNEGCMQQVILGIARALVDLVKGVGYLASAAWGLIKKPFVDFFANDEVHKSDDAMSEALLASQNLSDQDKKEMSTDFFGWVKKISSAIVTGMFDTAKMLATCSKWTGTPLVSECAEPTPAWDCMGCGDKAETFCALAGAISSDLVLSFVGGAGISFGAGVVNGLAKGGELASALRKISSVAEVAMHTKVGQVIGKTGSVAGKGLGATFNALNKIPGLKQWNHLNEKAFLSGVRFGSSRYASAVSKTTKATEAELKALEEEPSRILNYCPGDKR